LLFNISIGIIYKSVQSFCLQQLFQNFVTIGIQTIIYTVLGIQYNANTFKL